MLDLNSSTYELFENLLKIFIYNIITDIQTLLKTELNKFIDNEVLWIRKYKQSPKHTGVLIPVKKYPTFMLKVEIICGRAIPVLRDMIDSACNNILIFKVLTDVFALLN